MTSEILTRKALNRALFARQMLLAREKANPLEVTSRLVGLQAQQTRPPFLGLWSRILGFEREDLAAALKNREIVRATLMRGTLHLMTAADYAAFRPVLQPGLSLGARSVLRDRMEGLNVEELVEKARGLFESEPRTFTELRGLLMEIFPGGDERAMGYVVRTHLPLVMVPDESNWAYPADAKFTLADKWLNTKLPKTEDASDLVLRYLAAFGPATAADMQAWSGLPTMKPALEKLRPQLVTFRDEKKELFDLPDAPRPGEEAKAPIAFLADFDNIILSHVDRSRIIADEHRAKVVTKNLLVLPTFLVDGFVAGTWKAARARKTVTLTMSPFGALTKTVRSQLTKEAEKLIRFAEPEAAEYIVKFDE